MITVYDHVRIGTVHFRSGRFYTYLYTNYSNDPGPVGVMVNYVHGIHPVTGNMHQYLQMINLNYVPRQFRRLFVEQWRAHLKANKGQVLLTWRKVRSKFPFLQFALRRYHVNRGFIKYQRLIPDEDLEKVVISSFSRDFSITAWKQAIKLRGGKKGGPGRATLSNKPLSGNTWFMKRVFSPPI